MKVYLIVILVKTLAWTLYIGILTRLIAGIWIINTLNILEVDLDL